MIEAERITKEAIIRQVCEIITSVRPRLAGAIGPDTVLTRALGFDSLALVEIVIGVEERFGITTGNFEELDVERAISVRDLAELVTAKLGSVDR